MSLELLIETYHYLICLIAAFYSPSEIEVLKKLKFKKIVVDNEQKSRGTNHLFCEIIIILETAMIEKNLFI